MLNVNQLIGFGVGGGVLSVSYISRGQQTSSATTYTFASQDIGNAAADRWVIVGAGWYDNSGSTTTISSVSVGGNACTPLIQRGQTLGGGFMVGCGLFAVFLPGGTTANIVVTMSEAVAACHIAVWNLNSPSDTSPYDTDSTSLNTTGTPLSMSIDAYAGAAVIGYVMDIGNSTSNVWTGLTEDFDFATGSDTHTGASLKVTTESIPLAISIARTSPGSGVAAVAIAWR